MAEHRNIGWESAYAGGSGGQGGYSGPNSATLSTGQTTPLVLNGGNGGDGGRGGWLYGQGGTAGQGGTGSPTSPAVNLTVSSSFTLLNNTPGSQTVAFLIGPGGNVTSVSPAGATMATGGTQAVTVTFSAGNTSGSVLFQGIPAVAGTPGHAGNAGANGLL